MTKKPDKETFYITTPIYYVNDIPHIGHAYTTIIADTLSRYKKLSGYDVFFLTGTDEHGQKVQKSASEKGMKPIELADKVVGRFKNLWKSLNISYDFFIRTTEPFHERGIQKIFQKLYKKGDIYKGIYKGWYCISDENFLPEDVPLEQDGSKICPDCGKKANLVSEETYFFKLSSYQDCLLKHYTQNPDFVRPKSRMNEVVSFVQQGLKDLSITRTSVQWGVAIPDDPDHTIYVWFDALHNYLTGIGFDRDMELFNKFWPATVQLIGKDILRFHAVYWLAFLMAADFSLPKTVFSHGWWLKDESKMSKSKGNVLDPHSILQTFGADPLRYFLLREIPIGYDGNFSHEGFIHRVNSDLANDLGNLVQRTLTMICKYFNGTISEINHEQEQDKKLRLDFEKTQTNVRKFFDDYSINRALEEIWNYINKVNRYIAENEPWKLSKDKTQRKRLGRVLYQTAAAIRGITYLLYPVIPESSQKIWTYLGIEDPLEKTLFDELDFNDFKTSQKIKKSEPLFPRILLEDFIKEEAAHQTKSQQEGKMNTVTFDEFKKMDLRVAEIKKAERIEGTDKLLKLEVDIGTETRQLVAGIAEVYAPEDLIGKKLPVIVNLQPAKIRGIESKGMILATSVEGKPSISFFDPNIPAGSQIT